MRLSLIVPILSLVLVLPACSTVLDPHAPDTIEAPENGGEVEVSHGNRLLVRLPAPAQGLEWRQRVPMTMVVMADGLPGKEGLRMTPIRSGKSTLRFEELPERGEGSAQRTVSYEVTVP
jgi:hypothetical protein